MRICLFAIVLLFVSITSAQGQDDLEFGDTPSTSLNPKYKHDHSDYEQRKVVHWIKNDSKGLLIGNPCMEDVLQEMGFTYLIQFKGEPGQKKAFPRYFHNKGAKTVIFFRNGPFWRFKLRKKRKECRLKTGDFVG